MGKLGPIEWCGLWGHAGWIAWGNKYIQLKWRSATPLFSERNGYVRTWLNVKGFRILSGDLKREREES